MKPKKRKKHKKQFAPGKGRVKAVKRKVYAKPYESPFYDHREAEINKAFQANGAQGIMDLLDLGSTQAYRLIARFRLIRDRDEERNKQAEIARKQENFEYLQRRWGWDGSQRLVLQKYTERKKGCLFRCGKKCYPLPRTIRRYSLPHGDVRKYLLDQGVKWWVVDGKDISVRKTRNKHCVCVTAE